MAVKLTKNNFKEEVINSSVPVLVDFWASWCGPCKMIAPIIDEISAEFEGRAKVGKVNVDEEKELAGVFQIMSIPTIIVFKDGRISDSTVGIKPKAQLVSMLEKAIGN